MKVAASITLVLGLLTLAIAHAHSDQEARNRVGRSSTGPGQAASDKVNRFIKAEMRKEHIPGLSIAVVKNGVVVKARGYGFANLESKTPATASTIYNLCSVNQAVHRHSYCYIGARGKLRLDDAITSYLTGLPQSWSKISIRHLLTMTSGIPNTDLDRIRQLAHSREEVIGTVTDLPLDFAPGERWRYSNSNYILLAMIVNAVSGKDCEEFVEEQILRPIGMTSTHLKNSRQVVPRRAAGYKWDHGRSRNSLPPFPAEWAGASALESTVLDLAKWDAALRADKLLPATWRTQMWTPGRLNNGSTTQYGFGWYIGDVFGHKDINHSGASYGVNTSISRFIDDGITVIVSSNEETSNASFIGTRVAGWYNPSLLPPEPR
jgi:CubicO group peptidase (beta-lactamase class C family)